MNVADLSTGKSMTVWKRPCSAAGPSPTSMYLLSAVSGELIWSCVRAWASSRVSSLVEGDETSKDLGRDKEVCPAGETRRMIVKAAEYPHQESPATQPHIASTSHAGCLKQIHA